MNENAKILIVDDDPFTRKLLNRILNQLGFHSILEADDGTAAWDILENETVDLVIADWVMPQMSGLELLKKIRSGETTNMTPFIMLTGQADKENVLEAVNSGASNYIVKPFSAETIRDNIGSIFM